MALLDPAKHRRVDQGEACDDGNQADDDACTNGCDNSCEVRLECSFGYASRVIGGRRYMLCGDGDLLVGNRRLKWLSWRRLPNHPPA